MASDEQLSESSSQPVAPSRKSEAGGSFRRPAAECACPKLQTFSTTSCCRIVRPSTFPSRNRLHIIQHGGRNRSQHGRQDGVLHVEGGDRGPDLRGHASEGESTARRLRIRLRVALGRAIARYRTDLQRSRHYCSGSIGNRKDRHLFHLYPPGHRHSRARNTGYACASNLNSLY